MPEPSTPDCEHGYRAAGGTYDCPACEFEAMRRETETRAMPAQIIDRRSRRKLAALWKSEYDLLARFNRDKARGVTHDPEHVAHMKTVQRDYDENYLPASREIEAQGKWRRCWRG